ncbi:MAG: 2-C-methyl-D-erythritol 4-phosphate cytidylyltransferase [Pseudomonadota bacterium]
MSTNPVPFWAVIPAAGAGRRMGSATPKQYLEIHGRAVLHHTVARLAAQPGLRGIVVAVDAADEHFDTLAADLPGPVHRVTGGAERADSVLAALDHLAGHAAADEWVLVHDAARPCLRGEDLDRLLTTLAGEAVGGLLGVPVVDTVKHADPGGVVDATVDRRGLWRALTPQMFRLGLLREALTAALAAGVPVTDEASAVEWAGHRPHMVEGAADNVKITRPEDLALAALYLDHQTEMA